MVIEPRKENDFIKRHSFNEKSRKTENIQNQIFNNNLINIDDKNENNNLLMMKIKVMLTMI